MTTAVLVIDMINDFVTGKYGSDRAVTIISNIKYLLYRARKKKIPIIYLRDSHTKEDWEMGIWGEHAMRGTRGSEIVDQLAPKEGDIVIEKNWYSGFIGTDLDRILKQLKVDTLICVGVSTDICVQNNVGSAYFKGYKTIVPEDCAASIAPEAHEYALKYMKMAYGARITNSKDVTFD